MSARRGWPPDVVPTADESQLRSIYGEDADEVIAFGRFLRLPKNDQGQVLTPQHWHDWASGKIDAAEALRLDNAICTGLTAAWCPVHGDCTCPDREEAMDSPDCPLHGHGSTHAEGKVEAVGG